MNIYKKALVVGSVMGVVGAGVVTLLGLVGLPKPVAMAVGVGVVSASVGFIALKRSPPDT